MGRGPQFNYIVYIYLYTDVSAEELIVSNTAILNTFMTTAQKKNNELPIIPNPRMDKSTEKSHPQRKTGKSINLSKL